MQNKNCNKEEVWRVKIFKAYDKIISEDFGNEPEVFEEEDLRSQIYKTITVRKSVYEQLNNNRLTKKKC